MLKEDYSHLIKTTHDYLLFFQKEGYIPKQLENKNKKFSEYSEKEIMEHFYYMAEQVILLFEEEKYAKANRWLGFLQSGLWHKQIITLEGLMRQNTK